MEICDEKELSKQNALILYKTAMDSIPVERRMVLRILAKYRHATTKSLAVKLHYPTEPVKVWLNQLNALKIINRNGKDGNSDLWQVNPEYKATILKYENLFAEDIPLEVTEDEIIKSGVDENSNPGYFDDTDERLLEKVSTTWTSEEF